ncbi:MAG: alanine racemase [Proteobacteria bacterium]|nr:alanine racemase [Pseudomonadota bacterium]
MGQGEAKNRAWAEIDLAALRRNYRWLKSRAGGRELIAVVKADAYGHGAVPVARSLAEEGAGMLAVVTPGEARQLREAGIDSAILLLGPLLDAAEVESCLALDLDLAATRLEALELYAAGARRSGRPARVHLKLDTGMGRVGLAPDEVQRAVAILRQSPSREPVGLMTHLAEADDARSPRTELQRRRLGEALALLRDGGLEPRWIHCDNSAGIARGCWPDASAVRPGIALYGAQPTLERGLPLEPVMSLWARVCHAKTVPAGATVGYGGEYRAEGPTHIVTAALGYADGFPRAASGFRLGAAGARLPLAGRVSCDLICAEAEGAGVEVGDPLLVFGRDSGRSIPVEQLADAAGTISYEILTRIGARVPRGYSGG